jgi:hypothetical protein
MSMWETVSDLATGAGTLVLAVATFASVRSANRSARVAEDSMLASMRPILMNTRHQDPPQKLSFMDDIWLVVPGGGAAVEVTNDAIYLGISLRNVGTGMGILHGWRIRTGVERPPRRPSLDDFRAQTRDLYISPADIGFWEGALRDPAESLFGEVAAAARSQGDLCIDLLYGDFQGGQRVITRFRVVHSPFAPREPGATPAGHGTADGWPGIGGTPNGAAPGGGSANGARRNGSAPGAAAFGGAAAASGGSDDLAAQPDGAFGQPAPAVGPDGAVIQHDGVQPGGARFAGAASPAPGAGPAARPAPAGPAHLPESSNWIATTVRHWNVDRPDPR